METIVVTRHTALVEYLIEEGIVAAGVRVIPHATEEDVCGKVVVGVLPLRLAALTRAVIEVPLHIPAELRGVELTLDQVREYAGKPRMYKVEDWGAPVRS